MRYDVMLPETWSGPGKCEIKLGGLSLGLEVGKVAQAELTDAQVEQCKGAGLAVSTPAPAKPPKPKKGEVKDG